MSWKPEVVADSSGKWDSNTLRFATKDEAELYVYDLMLRWTMVRDTRCIEVEDPVTAKVEFVEEGKFKVIHLNTAPKEGNDVGK